MKRHGILSCVYIALTVLFAILADHLPGDARDCTFLITGLFLGLFLPHWTMWIKTTTKKEAAHETTI
jgi:hypothetical protein